MLSRIRARLSYSNVMATFAVFAVLGGVSYAATTLPKNSVGSKQIKTGAVGSRQAAGLKCKDFKPTQPVCDTTTPVVPAGLSAVTTRSRTETLAQSCTFNAGPPSSTSCQTTGVTTVSASCNPGEQAVGGGYEGKNEGNSTNPVVGGRSTNVGGVDRPEPVTGTPTGWTVRASGSSSGPGGAAPPPPEVTVFVLCAS